MLASRDCGDITRLQEHKLLDHNIAITFCAPIVN